MWQPMRLLGLRSATSPKTRRLRQCCANVWNELSRHPRSPVSRFRNYEAAAESRVSREPRCTSRRGTCFCIAAWCCVDENDTEAERFFGRKAAWKFAEAVELHWCRARALPIDPDGRTGAGLVTQHRYGFVVQSRAFGLRPATQQWVVDAAQRQRDCPRMVRLTVSAGRRDYPPLFAERSVARVSSPGLWRPCFRSVRGQAALRSR